MIRSLWQACKRRAFVSSNVAVGARFHLGILSFVGASRRLAIGDDVYIGKFCSIQCNGRLGNGVLIANNVGLVGRRDHDPAVVGVSVRRAPWVGDTPSLADHPANWIEVGDDVWIGFGATVLGGIRIGRGAIVGAASVVARDVAPYDIVAGNPARTVGRRFTDAQIAEHEAALRARP